MYEFLIISLLILNYVWIKYYVQKEEMLDKRFMIKNACKQALYYLGSSLLLTVTFLGMKLFIVLFFLSIVHVIIENLYRYYFKDKKPVSSFVQFTIAQLTHLIIIISTYPFLHSVEPNYYIHYIVTRLIDLYPFLSTLIQVPLLIYVTLILAGYLFAIRGGTIFTLLFINLPKDKMANEKKKETADNAIAQQELNHNEVAATMDSAIIDGGADHFLELEQKKKYGKVIGNIERIFIISAILIQQYQIIAILIAIKSIGRFKEINNKTSDYYIVGTLASFSIAFVIGLILYSAKRVLLD